MNERAYFKMPDDYLDKLTVSVVNYEKNQLFLSNKPFVRKGSMAIIPLINIGGNKWIPLTNEMVEDRNTTKFEVINRAVANANRLYPASCEYIGNLVEPSEQSSVSSNIYNLSLDASVDVSKVMVLSNVLCSSGAAAIFYASEKLGEISNLNNSEQIYISPVSSDFVLCMAANDSLSREQIFQAFKSIAESFGISEDKRICDNVLIYNASNSEITEFDSISLDAVHQYDLSISSDNAIKQNNHR